MGACLSLIAHLRFALGTFNQHYTNSVLLIAAVGILGAKIASAIFRSRLR